MDCLESYIERHPNRVSLSIDGPDSSSKSRYVRELLQTYNLESYSSMNQDSLRNKLFRRAVDKLVKNGVMNWLEIGPGASGTLTRMVLDNPRTTVVGIEGNEDAVMQVNRALCGLYSPSRFEIISGISTRQDTLQDLRDFLEEKPVRKIGGVIQEIFGFFASSEGVARAILALQDHRLVKFAPFSTPPFFAYPTKPHPNSRDSSALEDPINVKQSYNNSCVAYEGSSPDVIYGIVESDSNCRPTDGELNGDIQSTSVRRSSSRTAPLPLSAQDSTEKKNPGVSGAHSPLQLKRMKSNNLGSASSQSLSKSEEAVDTSCKNPMRGKFPQSELVNNPDKVSRLLKNLELSMNFASDTTDGARKTATRSKPIKGRTSAQSSSLRDPSSGLAQSRPTRQCNKNGATSVQSEEYTTMLPAMSGSFYTPIYFSHDELHEMSKCGKLYINKKFSLARKLPFSICGISFLSDEKGEQSRFKDRDAISTNDDDLGIEDIEGNAPAARPSGDSTGSSIESGVKNEFTASQSNIAANKSHLSVHSDSSNNSDKPVLPAASFAMHSKFHRGKSFGEHNGTTSESFLRIFDPTSKNSSDSHSPAKEIFSVKKEALLTMNSYKRAMKAANLDASPKSPSQSSNQLNTIDYSDLLTFFTLLLQKHSWGKPSTTNAGFASVILSLPPAPLEDAQSRNADKAYTKPVLENPIRPLLEACCSSETVDVVLYDFQDGVKSICSDHVLKLFDLCDGIAPSTAKVQGDLLSGFSSSATDVGIALTRPQEIASTKAQSNRSCASAVSKACDECTSNTELEKDFPLNICQQKSILFNSFVRSFAIVNGIDELKTPETRNSSMKMIKVNATVFLQWFRTLSRDTASSANKCGFYGRNSQAQCWLCSDNEEKTPLNSLSITTNEVGSLAQPEGDAPFPGATFVNCKESASGSIKLISSRRGRPSKAQQIKPNVPYMLSKLFSPTSNSRFERSRRQQPLQYGCLEFLNFRESLRCQMVQTRRQVFPVLKTTPFNGLGCFMWCMLHDDPDVPNRRPGKAAYPYGVSGLPELPNHTISFSSNESDLEICASNWRNIIVPLPKTVIVHAGGCIVVDTIVDLTPANAPIYAFRASVLSPNATLADVPSWPLWSLRMGHVMARQVEEADALNKRRSESLVSPDSRKRPIESLGGDCSVVLDIVLDELYPYYEI